MDAAGTFHFLISSFCEVFMVSQIIVVSIFLVMFLLIIADRFPRQYVTLICGALTLLLVFVAGMSFDNRKRDAVQRKA